MEEIRLALKQDYVWKIRTLYKTCNLDINDSPVTLSYGFVCVCPALLWSVSWSGWSHVGL